MERFFSIQDLIKDDKISNLSQEQYAQFVDYIDNGQAEKKQSENMLITKFGKEDKRNILEYNDPNHFPTIGQLYMKKVKKIFFGSGVLVQIQEFTDEEIKLHKNIEKLSIFSTDKYQFSQFVQQMSEKQKFQYEFDKAIFCILTCAHNLLTKQIYDNQYLKPESLSIILGKRKGEFDGVNNPCSLKLDLDCQDILYPCNYQEGNQTNGYDIALIGLSKENKKKVVQYLTYYKKLNIMNDFQNFQDFHFKINHNTQFSFVDDNIIFNDFKKDSSLFNEKQEQNLGDMIKIQKRDEIVKIEKYRLSDYSFEIGVCGYSGDLKGFPQVNMFKNISNKYQEGIFSLKQAYKKKVLVYDEIQTQEGQSGSPILLKYKSDKNIVKYQVVGVHTGGTDDQNFGTYFENLPNLKSIFTSSSNQSKLNSYQFFIDKQKDQQFTL